MSHFLDSLVFEPPNCHLAAKSAPAGMSTIIIMTPSVDTYPMVGRTREGHEIHSWEIGRYEKEALLQTMVGNTR